METARRRGREIAGVILVFTPLLFLRIVKDAGPGPYGLDASQYVQIARHVAAGDGLITTMSLYHHGYVLPVATTVQPLWLLLLGYTGRAIGMIEAATLLPRIFYVAALLLLFALVRLIAPRFDGESRLVGYAPHAVIALLGLNVMFFSSTTHPYREGLAYALAFAALLAMEWVSRTRSMISGAVAGALAALAWLARLEVAAVGVGCVLALVVCRLPFRLILGYIVTGAIVIAPWLAVLGYVPGLRRFGSWVDRPSVAIPDPGPPPLSAGEKVLDWLDGAMVAFQVGNPHSFTRIWGVAALLVPLAVIVALLVWAKTRERPLPRDLTVLATAFAAIVIFIEVFFYRGGTFMHFMFGWRHGIALVLPLAIAVPYLLADERRVIRVVTAVAIVISLATGALAVTHFVLQPNNAYTSAESAFLEWLPPKKTVLTTRAEMLGMTSDAYFHNTYCDSPPETTRAYVEKLRVDYVVVFDHERRCRFTKGVGDVLRVHATFGNGPQRIWLLAPRR